MKTIGSCALLVALTCIACAPRVVQAQLQSSAPGGSIAHGVGIDQHLGAQLPLDLPFRDEKGRAVKLGDYFGQRPVVLTLVYYRCPMLCTQVLNGLLKSSQAVPLGIGVDYDVVTVSFDERETSELAAAKKKQYVGSYRRPGAERGWHFLTGERESIEALARTVGFRYKFDPGSDQFAHASGITVATPSGELSRYFYGIDYPPGDLRLALVESADGQIGSPVDQFLLLCFHYDPRTGKYGLAISNLLKVFGTLTALLLGGYIWRALGHERRRGRLALAASSKSDSSTPLSPAVGHGH